ncbi:MAG: hypothetical protein WCS86_02015 [Candidatus Paceibacterota bacterium]
MENIPNKIMSEEREETIKEFKKIFDLLFDSKEAPHVSTCSDIIRIAKEKGLSKEEVDKIFDFSHRGWKQPDTFSKGLKGE